jgi:hypothetical protein
LNSKELFKSELTLDEQVLAYLESGFRQFWSDGDFSIWGDPDGWGIMQVDPPSNLEQVWNWRANIAEGKARFAEKKSMAASRPSNVRSWGGKYRYASDFTQQEYLTDAFQLYNGYHYWVWVPTFQLIPSLGGHWGKNPKVVRDYGGTAIKIYNTVQNGGTQSGW